MVPGEKFMGILSSPRVVADNNLLKFLSRFDTQIWVSILMSYLLLTTINIIVSRDCKLNFNLILDYIFIFLGRG